MGKKLNHKNTFNLPAIPENNETSMDTGIVRILNLLPVMWDSFSLELCVKIMWCQSRLTATTSNREEL